MTSDAETRAGAPREASLRGDPAGWRARAPHWRSRGTLALCGFLPIAAFLLLTGHETHLFAALPFLFLLACPLMHLFIHGRHRPHENSDNEGSIR